MGWGERHADCRPGTGHELVEHVSEVVAIVRQLRYENPSTFDDVTPAELETVARGLRAVAYSCQEGARLLDRIRARRGHESSVPATSRALGEQALEILDAHER